MALKSLHSRLDCSWWTCDTPRGRRPPSRRRTTTTTTNRRTGGRRQHSEMDDCGCWAAGGADDAAAAAAADAAGDGHERLVWALLWCRRRPRPNPSPRSCSNWCSWTGSARGCWPAADADARAGCFDGGAGDDELMRVAAPVRRWPLLAHRALSSDAVRLWRPHCECDWSGGSVGWHRWSWTMPSRIRCPSRTWRRRSCCCHCSTHCPSRNGWPGRERAPTEGSELVEYTMKTLKMQWKSDDNL